VTKQRNVAFVTLRRSLKCINLRMVQNMAAH